jgi:hypothetical protein
MRRRRAAIARERKGITMNTNRTAIYLHAGRAWVAELKDGRARVWSLSAWLSAHPGRGALRSLARGTQPPPAPRAGGAWSGRARRGLASLIGHLLGTGAPPDPHHPDTAG